MLTLVVAKFHTVGCGCEELPREVSAVTDESNTSSSLRKCYGGEKRLTEFFRMCHWDLQLVSTIK